MVTIMTNFRIHTNSYPKINLTRTLTLTLIVQGAVLMGRIVTTGVDGIEGLRFKDAEPEPVPEFLPEL